MASSSSHLSEEELQCSICLEVFNDPVTLPCGHNFCKVCINSYLDNRTQWQCPLCKNRFIRRPSVNTTLRVVAEHVKTMSREKSPAGPGEVSCDVCTGTKRKALKSCLGCLGSYCETHLSPHLRVPAFKKHKLIHPVENLEDRMCAVHVRMLEYFCRTDQTFICVMCLNTDHKSHNAVALEEECGQRKAELMADIDRIKNSICLKVEEIMASVETSKDDTEKVCVEVFAALVSSIQRSQAVLADLMSCIQTKQAEFVPVIQEAVEEWAQGLIQDLEREINALTERSSELDSLTDDHLHLLQTFPSLSTYAPTRDWSRIWSRIRVHQSELPFVNPERRMVSEIADSLNGEIVKLRLLVRDYVCNEVSLSG